MQLPAVQRQVLSEQIAQILQDQILAGSLKPGDRLPTERDLASHFGVSRTVIREATRGLANKGLLNISPGRGAIVTVPENDAISGTLAVYYRADLDYLVHLQEVRRVLEVEIARLAAERRTNDDLDIMRQALRQVDMHMDDPKEAVEGDLRFHRSLAVATKNRIYQLLADSMLQVMRESMLLRFQVPRSMVEAQRGHRRVLDAVERGDAVGAAQAMAEHIAQSEETLRQALSERERKAETSATNKEGE